MKKSEASKEHAREYAQNYYSEHKGAIRDQQNPRQREYYRANREMILQQEKERREADPEKARAQRRKSYAKHRERRCAERRARYYADIEESRRKGNERSKRYYQAHKEEIGAQRKEDRMAREGDKG